MVRSRASGARHPAASTFSPSREISLASWRTRTTPPSTSPTTSFIELVPTSIAAAINGWPPQKYRLRELPTCCIIQVWSLFLDLISLSILQLESYTSCT